MNRFLTVLALIVIGVGVLGFYRGWFHFTSGGDNDKANIGLTVDKEKIREDEKNAADRIHRIAHPNDKATAPTEKNE